MKFVRFTFFFIFVSSALLGLEGNASESYVWAIEKSSAIGCFRQNKEANQQLKRCAQRHHLDLACANIATQIFIRDLDICRRHLPTKSAWLVQGGSRFCVEFAEANSEEQHSRSVLRFLRAEDCEHNTLIFDNSCEILPGLDLRFHPNSRFSIEDLIPEIMNLKHGQTVPKEVYRKFDARKIGLTIVYKIHKELEGKKSTETLSKVDLLNGTELVMAFPDSVIDGIQKRGFLNQHQLLKSSGGFLRPDDRATTEDAMLGYHLERTYQTKDPNRPVNTVRPKYAYLSFKGPPGPENPGYEGSMNPGYGNVFAVFNPEVKDRTTFTMDDSLDAVEAGDARTLFTKNDSPLYPGYKIPEDGTYVEAQIWGDLTFTDVHHFIVNCDQVTAPVSSASLEKLKKIGKPIYGCLTDSRPQQIPPQLANDPAYVEAMKRGAVYRVRKGDLIYSGGL